MERSPSHRKNKCDEKDAEQILKYLRGYILAGNELPTVWIPDDETRDCREVVRCRMDLSDKSTRIKVQAQGLLKRYGIQRPSEMKKSWTKRHRAWMDKLGNKASSSLDYGARVYLRTLISQLKSIEKEIEILNKEVVKLSSRPKYERQVEALVKLKGVSILTAMVFLTELGDCTRFANRKKLGAYLGLVPSKYESGNANDRKGHITREGPYRIRKILCQAVWSRIRCDKDTKAFYEKIKEKNPKKTKVAVVACIRRIGILMWHRSVDAIRTGA
jgi:transposase